MAAFESYHRRQVPDGVRLRWTEVPFRFGARRRRSERFLRRRTGEAGSDADYWARRVTEDSKGMLEQRIGDA
jgi:hypothetical protein